MHVDIRAVYNKIDRFTAQVAKQYDVEDVKGPQGRTICYLHDHAGEIIYQKDLEELLSIQTPVASNLVKRMEKNGYITAKVSPSDRRLKQLQLTPKGESKVSAIREFGEAIHEKIMKDVSKEDFDVVIKVFKQIQKNISEEDYD